MKTISIEDFRKSYAASTDIELDQNPELPTVVAATDLGKNLPVALKIVPEKFLQRIQPSQKNQKKIEGLRHPNLLQNYELLAVADQKNAEKGKLYVFVSEYFQAGSLQNLSTTPLSFDMKKRIIDGVINGLEGLHNNGLIHGNLKPSNILIKNVGYPHTCLSDFGYLNQVNLLDLNVTFRPGQINYLAPEQIYSQTDPHLFKISKQVDFWALGVLIYEMFLNKHPFSLPDSTNFDIASRIKLADLPKDIHKIPMPYAKLVEACLVRNSANRPKSTDAIKKLLVKEEAEITRKSIPAQQIDSMLSVAKKAPPPPTICRNCGNSNPPQKTICSSCGKSLFGPKFLDQFHSGASVGVWALCFFALLLLPVGLIYQEIYDLCDFPTEGCRLSLKNVLETARSYPNALISAVFFVFTGLMSYIFFYWWTWRMSNNLYALGSQGRSYHPFFMVLGGINWIPGVIAFANDKIFLGIFLLVLVSVLPLWSMQEIWRGSDPAYLSEGTAWKQARSSFLIFSWWALSLIYPVILASIFLPSALDAKLNEFWFWGSLIMTVSFWVVSFAMIIRINYRQRAKFLALAKKNR